MRATVKLGNNITLEIEEREEKETLHKAIVLSSPRRVCNICGNKSGFYFVTNKATTDQGTFTYINYKCPCGAKSGLGEYKTGGYFWKEFEKYQKEEEK
jgi:hypothetical protein